MIQGNWKSYCKEVKEDMKTGMRATEISVDETTYLRMMQTLAED